MVKRRLLAAVANEVEVLILGSSHAYFGIQPGRLGRKAFTALSDLGFQTTGLPSNRGTGIATTVVYYGPTRKDSAATLSAALPGSVTMEDSSLRGTLEVVVGSGYSGVRAVAVSGATQPATPTDPAKPAIQRTADQDVCAGAV